MTRCVLSLLICGLVAVKCLADVATVDRHEVQQLLRQLEDRQLATRDAAETQLREMGAGVLKLLPRIGPRTSGNLKQRILRIRDHLEKQQVNQSAAGTRVTLRGKMTLMEALASLEEQTGNRVIDYRTRFNQPSVDTQVEVDFVDVPYWEALDQLLDQAELTINNFVGEARKLAIIARSETALPRYGRAVYNGLFRIEPTHLFAERDLRNPGASTLRLGLEIIWEPRVLPLLIRQDLDNIELTADNGDALGMATTGQIQLPVQPGVSAIDLRLPLELPPRDVKMIASLKGQFTALIPGGVETFEFDELVGARNVRQRRGGLTVILDRVRRNGGAQEISVRLRFDQPGESLQSHLDWVSNNEAILLDPSGKQADEPNYEKYLERENEVGFSYLFPVSGPLTGYKFIYKTPSSIAEVPIDYELRDITLP